MNILVCVKQVPDTTEIKVDPETNTLIRAGVPSIVNPFDAYALETAVRLKERCGGVVTAVCMGPPQAKAALKECLSVGADEAVLVTDRAFGGSDTLATSYILSGVVRLLGGFDLILCGKQAIDGDTGQVGPELAEHLGLAQITYAADVEMADGNIRVKRECDNGWEILEAALPTVVTVIKTAHEPRMATLRSKMAANRATIREIGAQDLDLDPAMIGLKGSPTKVKKTFTPRRDKSGVKIAGVMPAQAAAGLADWMAGSGLLAEGGTRG